MASAIQTSKNTAGNIASTAKKAASKIADVGK